MIRHNSRPAPLCLCGLSCSSGCRQDMHDQPKHKPLRDERVLPPTTARPAPGRGHGGPGAAHGRLSLLHGQGRTVSSPRSCPCASPPSCWPRGADALPDLLLALPRPHRGGRRHDRAARVQEAAARSTTTGCARLPVGYFFDVMTNGFGAMSDYAPRCRWPTAGPSPPTSAPCSCSQNATPRRRARRQARAPSTSRAEGAIQWHRP